MQANQKVRLNVLVDKDLYEFAKKYCKEYLGISLSHFIRTMLINLEDQQYFPIRRDYGEPRGIKYSNNK